MASNQARGNGRRVPLTINTNQPSAHPRRDGSSRDRFSWAETPVEMEEPQIRPQQFQPKQSPIPQSPLDSPHSTRATAPNSPGLEQQQHQYHQAARQTTQPTGSQPSSPYHRPQPVQTHPAYFVPVVSDAEATQPPSRPGSIPPPTEPSPQSPPPLSPPLPYAYRSSTHKPPLDALDRKPPLTPYTPIHAPHAHLPLEPDPQPPPFTPTALVGPNGLDAAVHQPGQIAHPNMTFGAPGAKEPWEHGLCSCGADVGTCALGLLCPCVLAPRTAHRLAAKSAHGDPTDLLGFAACNAGCVLMALLGPCGACCVVPLVNRVRVRRAYGLKGSLVGDVARSCACCVCGCCAVAVQSEREVRVREERRRAWAGPAQVVGLEKRTVSMKYAPGGG